MFFEKKALKSGIFGLVILMGMGFIGTRLAQAQNWSAIPPYNLLWPLWSPALSPVDPVTDVPTPLISELTIDTVLPVHPVMVWDPSQEFPWLLYNIPSVLGGGITWFNPFYGFNYTPPTYMLDPLTGDPAPISLPVGYESLPPPDIYTFGKFFNPSNLTYATLYPPDQYGYSFFDFLTPAEVWGLPALFQ